uniref:Uncharacterized protein n=1 Tax=Mycena chlorophos TaxID=658473 RepID=A0ABQ0LGY9_MYCCL|nr:predicted protein [Mycena chlorophos]
MAPNANSNANSSTSTNNPMPVPTAPSMANKRYLTSVLCSICGTDTGVTIAHSMPKGPVTMTYNDLRCVECTRKWVLKRWVGIAEAPAAAAGSFIKREQVEVEMNS